MHAGGSSVRLYDGPDCCLAHRGPTGDSLLLQIFSGVDLRDLQLPGNTLDLSNLLGTFRDFFTVMIH